MLMILDDWQKNATYVWLQKSTDSRSMLLGPAPLPPVGTAGFSDRHVHPGKSHIENRPAAWKTLLFSPNRCFY